MVRYRGWGQWDGWGGTEDRACQAVHTAPIEAQALSQQPLAAGWPDDSVRACHGRDGRISASRHSCLRPSSGSMQTRTS